MVVAAKTFLGRNKDSGQEKRRVGRAMGDGGVVDTVVAQPPAGMLLSAYICMFVCMYIYIY